MRRMLLAVVVLALAGHSGLCQQSIPNAAGIWELSIGKSFSAKIQITQSGTALTAQFTPVQHLTPAFTTSIGLSSTRGWDMLLKWNTSRTDIPGINVPYAYWGVIASDGSSISGGYGESPSQSVGTWSATRIAGLGPAIIGVRNAASGSLGPIAPGEIISIYANADINPIGPQTGTALQIDQSGKVSTSAGGVQVHFMPIDAYAPITYAGAGQVNAVVPYEAGGLSAVDAEIVYFGQTSPPFALQVGQAALGIFTANGSGGGPGAILNHDGTLNGPNNPEPPGGYVTLFVTGEGQTNPPGVSGKVTTLATTAPITPAPVSPVAARINGQSAPVLFAGEAPGLVSGVLQINIQVPTAVSPGNVPVQVTIGGVQSQNGVTVTVQ